ncbi:hypothetical protein SEUCBS139899_001568 [Sporothrix eucalyptigena]|uniref:Isochorismatase-like domain-containing protein n=1 Tax=Sporothrix eucalyptigena TaxID=1812306 RepID=A0ABP0BN28_9PEZI
MSTLALNPASYPEYAAECGDPSRTKVLGFGKRPALLLVDVCEAYFDPESPIAVDSNQLETVTAAISALITAGRHTTGDNDETKLPVIFAQTLYVHPELRDAGLLGLKTPSHAALFHKDGPTSKIAFPAALESVKPLPSDLYHRKQYPSPFFGTNLASQLAALDIDTVILGGFATSGSVRATALDAMQAGYRPMVVAEACGDSGGRETHWANLFDVGAKYSDVVSLEAAVKVLRGDQ